MKALGIKQFHQKKFTLLPIEGTEYADHLGYIPRGFVMVVGGFSGNGKTEYCVRLAKFFCRFGKVAWLSFEQRHGYDLQMATMRNKMEEVSGLFIAIDPIANLPRGKTYLEDLDEYASRRNSPDFYFIDSVDYTGWKKEDYLYLKEKYDGKKTFVFICHTDKSGNARKTISADIIFDGGMFFFVKSYIATPQKNRFGGFEPYVIWEEKARELNPVFFAKAHKEGHRVNGKNNAQQTRLFAKNEAESDGIIAKNSNEQGGVDAELKVLKGG